MGSGGREEETRRGARHTLIRQGFQLLLFHLSGFISSLILDFRTPSHILKSWRFHSLGGQDYSNEIVPCHPGNITTCSSERGEKEVRLQVKRAGKKAADLQVNFKRVYGVNKPK